MARSENQKLKSMYILEFLMENTDNSHYVTMGEILDYLHSHHIEAERKSIYGDIQALKGKGYDIEGVSDKGRYKYHLINRPFELAELKLLVDTVQSSRFITESKSTELIKKIETLCSTFEAKELNRQVYVSGRIKTMNESIYYNVDNLHIAINQNLQISFQYCKWMVNKKTCLKREGSIYQVSPWALIWNNENYYLVAYDKSEDKIKHFRVDKILRICVLEEEREGKDFFDESKVVEYGQKMFSMYGGTEECVKLKCHKELVGIIFDRFGKEISIVPVDEDYFTVKVDVVVSRQFLAWVMGLGEGVRIVEPCSVVEMMRAEVKRLWEEYR